MTRIGKTTLFIFGMALLGCQAAAQGVSLPLPIRQETIASAKLGETREFWVSLPDGYDGAAERYPVLYMMDGEFNFNSGVIGGLRQAAALGELPEFIVVGIRNTDRMKDVFPEEVTFADGSKAGGRADRYLDFIRDELIPHIDKTYRSGNFRVLYGTSNSGFTAVYALLHDPRLADAYVAASATLRPLFRSPQDDPFAGFAGGRRRLCLVMGENDFPTVVSLNGKLKETIAMAAPAGLSCRLRVIENGEHVPANALLEGMRTLFAGWKIAQPLDAETFSEIRAQVERRPERFGLAGAIREDELRALGESLLAARNCAKALEVLQYRAQSYPLSAAAQVDLGEAFRQCGDPARAREHLRQALQLAPDSAAAKAKLLELGGK